MTAKDIMIQPYSAACTADLPPVDADMPLIDVLYRLLDSPTGSLAVADGDIRIGVIDPPAMLRGLAALTSARDDCSTLTVECHPEDYSASLLAHAVEDADAHLVDLLTAPGENGNIRVTLRVRISDPSPVIHSLERYDFHVVESYSDNNVCETVAAERLLALQTLLNV